MSKKCNNCGFQQNPDNAHYCGKCGKQLGYSDNYKLYNASLQTPVYNSTLNNYKKYERQINSSWLFNTWDKIKSWWNKSGKEVAQFWMWFSLFMAVVFGATFFIARSCSSDNKIARIEINGKYGIGYNEDKMLVQAIYDSISPTDTGNQWLLFDKSTSNIGLAYVTDSVANVMDPQTLKAKYINRNVNGYSQIRLDGTNMHEEGKYVILSKGLFKNKVKYKRLKYPGYKDRNCVVATLDDEGMQMLGNDGMPIDGKTYFNIVIDPDSMIRAIHYTQKNSKIKNFNITTIHDYTGRQTSEKEFYGVNAFSDGVAWAYLTEQDRKNSSHSLIDKHGNVLFANKQNAVNCIGFGDGVGWYAPSYSSRKYTAVDKSGNDLFNIEAYKVYPFTMGIAPIEKGTSYANSKLGFIDKTGKTVIPFKYKSKYSNPTFGRDSLMDGVSLNGIEGKLHRNGTFIPNK